VRIGACLMVAPVFGASYVPKRLRIVLAGAITLLAICRCCPRCRIVALLSADGVIITAEQLLIGVALGFSAAADVRCVDAWRDSCWPTAWGWDSHSTSIRCAA
jgi:flagellar biosynthesis protein FliR